MAVSRARIAITLVVLLVWELYQNRDLLQGNSRSPTIRISLTIGEGLSDSRKGSVDPASSSSVPCPSGTGQSNESPTTPPVELERVNKASRTPGALSTCETKRNDTLTIIKQLGSQLCPTLTPTTLIEFDRSRYEGYHSYYIPQRPGGEGHGDNRPVQACVDRLLAWLRRADHDHWETIGWSRDDYIFGNVLSVDTKRNVWEFFSRREQRRTGELMNVLVHYARYVEKETVFLVTMNDVDLWTIIANYPARKTDFERLLDECPIWYLHWNPTVDLKSGRLPKRTLPIPDPYRVDYWLSSQLVQPSGRIDQTRSSPTSSAEGQVVSPPSPPAVGDVSKTLLFKGPTSGYFVPHADPFADTDRYRIVASLVGTQCEKELSGIAELDLGFTQYVNGVNREVAPWEARANASAAEAAKAYAVLDVDGGADAWEDFRWKLGQGAVVLKVPSSRGTVQWYYKDLKDGIHLKMLPPLPTPVAESSRGGKAYSTIAQYCRQVRGILQQLSKEEYRANISVAARQFAQEHFTVAAVDDYLSELIPNVWKKEIELRSQDWRIVLP
jgi:hypothetical protein